MDKPLTNLLETFVHKVGVDDCGKVFILYNSAASPSAFLCIYMYTYMYMSIYADTETLTCKSQHSKW